MILRLVTAPTAEPVSLTETKLHLRVDVTADDALIERLITTAREYCEMVTRRALVTQTWRLWLDTWPDIVALPKSPLASVTTITYRNAAGIEATVPGSTYVVDADSDPGVVMLATGAAWPGVALYQVNPIAITFVAGYGNAAAVPTWAKQAILMLVGYWYENRESALIGQGFTRTDAPLATDALLMAHRAW